MSKTMGVFGFEMDTAGVSIYAARDLVTNAAVTNAELDAQIVLAKADLDAVAKRAKLALIKYRLKPPSGKR